MTDKYVALDSVTRRYNRSGSELAALDDVSLTISQGEFIGVVGHSGAGKSTLLNLIGGLDRPTSGSVTVDETDLSTLNEGALAEYRQETVGFVFQQANLVPALTVFENVQIAVLSRRRNTFNLLRPAKTMAVTETREILNSVGLLGQAEMTSGTLSHGDQKVLEIAVALGNRPELLILDEPTAGMSPEETAVTLRLMKRLSGELGLTILFCEHDMGLVFSVANRIMVMQHGCSIVEDTPEAVRSNPQVREAYLGSADVC